MVKDISKVNILSTDNNSSVVLDKTIKDDSKSNYLYDNIPIGIPRQLYIEPYISNKQTNRNYPLYKGFPVVNTLLKGGNLTYQQPPGSLVDPKMGPIASKKQKCEHCKNVAEFCPGHSGYYNFGTFIINPPFLKQLLNLLKRHLCTKCGEVKLEAKKKTCMKCNNKSFKFSCDGSYFYLIREDNVIIPSSTLYKLITKLPLEITKVNYNIADHYFTDYLYISANFVRAQAKTKSKGNINMFYQEIINNLMDVANYKVDNEKRKQTQLLVSILIDIMIDAKFEDKQKILKQFSKIYKDLNNKPNKDFSLKVLVSAKEGIVRNGILGKKISKMVRCVIIGDPNVSLNELHIPINIAKNITLKEVINQFNYKQVYQLLENSPNYPTVLSVKKKNEAKQIITENNRSSIKIEYGDIVERHVMNGDYAFFNRAPTLTHTSITAFELVIFGNDKANIETNVDSNDYVIKMNNLICPFFNADFDGDAMTLIFASKIASRLEMKYLNNVTQRVVSLKNAGLSIGIKEDAVIGLAQATMDKELVPINDVFLRFRTVKSANKYSFLQYMDNMTLTAHQAASYLIPPGITMSFMPTSYDATLSKFIKYDADSMKVIIKDSQISQGVLDSATSKLFKFILSKYDNKIMTEVIYDFQQYALGYLRQNAFTIGIKDLYIKQEHVDYIEKTLESIKRYCM